jgi:hypothetical protein
MWVRVLFKPHSRNIELYSALTSFIHLRTSPMWQHVFGHPSAMVRGLIGTIFSPHAWRSPVKMTVTILMHKAGERKDSPAVLKLRRAGVKIERVMPRIGVVTGSIDRSRLATLKALPEVKKVEETGTFHVGPLREAV